MIRFYAALLLSLMVLPVIRTQDQNAVSGFYELTFPPSFEMNSKEEQKIRVFLRQTDQQVELIELAYRQKLSLERSVKLGSYQVTGLIALDGNIGDEKLTCSIRIGNNIDLEIKAVKLASVWACSNHQDPIHTAESEREMRELTAKNACAGWHKLKAPD